MNKHFHFKGWLVAALLALSANAQATPINFAFDYLDGANEGFNDPILGAARRAALSYAGSLWGNLLPASYGGETIHVAVLMDPLGTSGSPLASTGNIGLYWNYSAMPSSTIYGAALANHLVGRDLNTTTDEMRVTFNSDMPFYLGNDGVTPSTQYDFQSLAMHEIGHGLGFFSRIDKDNSDSVIGGMLTTTSGSTGATNQFPSIYDKFLVDANGVQLINMSDAQRATAITSGALYWSGANGIAANGGVRPQLYAPTSPVAGSSIVHLDPSTHDLLDPNLAKGEHVAADPVTLGMLTDMGWTITPVPEASQIWMLLSGLALLAGITKRHAKA